MKETPPMQIQYKDVDRKNAMKRVRYGTKQNDLLGSMTKPLYTCSAHVEPLRYNAASHNLGRNLSDDDIAQLIDAIEQTEWVQWVKARMAASKPAGKGGGEVATAEPDPLAERTPATPPIDDDRTRVYNADEFEPIDPLAKAERDLARKREHFTRLSSPSASRFHYSRKQEQRPERYSQGRGEAHAALTAASDAYGEARRDVSDRARRHAEQHGVSYDAALAAVGGLPPTFIPTAAPV